jgi:tripartite-type tricarboxylate transporter receptor subunit TctC
MFRITMCRHAIKTLALIALTAPGLTDSTAHAQAYPARPIRIVVPFSPGGAADVMARLLAEKFASWGASVVVDNRTGASGIIGTDIVAKASPDGHTLGSVAVSFAINPSIHKLPYDLSKDFTYISIPVANSLVLVVNNNLPAKSVKELIDLAKAKPDTLNFATSGTGSSPHMSAELFKLMTGTRMTQVPYKGSTAAHPDLIGGQVNIMFDTLVSTVQLIRGGRLRALGVTASKRSGELPDVPTIAEAGVPGYEATSWIVFFAPANLPPAVLNKLHTETIKALALPDVKERTARLGSDIIGNNPVQARAFVLSEMQKWAKTVKAAGITSGQ